MKHSSILELGHSVPKKKCAFVFCFVGFFYPRSLFSKIYAPGKCAHVQNIACKPQIIAVKIVLHTNFNSGMRCYTVAPQKHINISVVASHFAC